MRESQRGRGRVSDFLDGAATTDSLKGPARSTSPTPSATVKKSGTNKKREVSSGPPARPATTNVGSRPVNKKKLEPESEPRQQQQEDEEGEEVSETATIEKKESPVEPEPLPPAFVVTPMHADDGDEEAEAEGNFFDFEAFGQVDHEASPFDDIAPDVATYGSVEEHINVLRESIGIPDEVVEEVGEEGTVSSYQST